MTRELEELKKTFESGPSNGNSQELEQLMGENAKLKYRLTILKKV